MKDEELIGLVKRIHLELHLDPVRLGQLIENSSKSFTQLNSELSVLLLFSNRSKRTISLKGGVGNFPQLKFGTRAGEEIKRPP